MGQTVKTLAELGLTARGGREVQITGVAVDSREVAEGFLFAALPGVMEAARWFSLLFLLYLAYKIATAAPPEGLEVQTTPINFLQAMLFQTINPKAVIVIISSVTTYASKAESLYVATIFITLIFAFVTITSTLLWAYAGSLFGRLLKNRRHLRKFNFTMAGMLVCSLTPASFNL